MKLGIFRKIINGLLLSGLVGFLTGPAIVSAAKTSEGCQFQGSWIGYNAQGAYWVSTVDGQSSSKETYKLEVPGFEITLGGMFATAARVSAARGTWERIDDYTFGVTVIGLVADTAENTLYIVKVSGIDILSADCNTMSIVNTIEFFYGNQDPFADTPFYVVYSPPHTGTRMRVDPPASP